jgi:hypothetical protein
MQSTHADSRPFTEDLSQAMRQRYRTMMWSQRDVELGVQNLISDLKDHAKLISDTSGEEQDEIDKLIAHVRYDLMTLAKKMEVAIEKTR